MSLFEDLFDLSRNHGHGRGHGHHEDYEHDHDHPYARPGGTWRPPMVAPFSCPSCHANFVSPPGARFCSSCGEPLAVERTCPGCTARLAPDAAFCPACGVKVS